MFSSSRIIFSSHGVEFGPPPNPPRNLTGSGMVRAVRLEWGPPVGSFNGISYVLQMSSAGGPWSDLSFSNLVSPEGGGAVNVEGLDPGLTYCFRVACSNRFGMSAWLSACVNPKSGPAAPTNVRAFRYRAWRGIGLFAPSRIFVDWDTPSSDMFVRGYIVDMKEGDQNWGDRPTIGGWVAYESAAQVSDTLAEDILDRYVVEDSARLFRVKADTGGGYGPWSSPVAVQDGLGMSPGPVDWSAVGGNVTMFWTAPADTKGYTLSGYVVSLAAPGLARTEYFVTGTSKTITVPTPSSGTIELRARYLNGPDVAAVPSSRYQVTLP
jgi:hypothetical protein